MQIEAHPNRWTNSKTFYTFPTITKFWCCNLQLVSHTHWLTLVKLVSFFQFVLLICLKLYRFFGNCLKLGKILFYLLIDQIRVDIRRVEVFGQPAFEVILEFFKPLWRRHTTLI